MNKILLGKVSNITKLAGFEHTKYIQPNSTENRVNIDDVPMFIGLNIKNGRLTNDIKWYIPFKLSLTLKRSALTKKCLVLPYVGSVGDLAIFDSKERHHLASNVSKIELDDNSPFSIEYLYYYLKSPYGQRQLLYYIQGGVQKNITMDAIRKTSIVINKNEKKIAKVLSDLDAKINLNNKINNELEALAKTLYDYWFVQFDFPDTNNKPYKSSGGKMFWNEELKREIPEGWEVKKLKELANTGSGGTPLSTKKEFYDNGDIPWINSGEVNEPFIVIAKKFITDEGLNNSSAKLFEKGTILMAMYGATAGKVSLIDIQASTNQAICAVMPYEEIYKYYIKFGLEDLYKYLISLSTGSARDNLSQDKIKELNFINPNKKILEKFDKIVYPMMNKILMNLKENQELASLRDWLLPMLMNGQVSVGEVSKDYDVNDEVLGMVAEANSNYKKG